ncbi:anthranilate synthase component II [Paraferrimonas sedimenticola]|uniref:Glutamine amidotransferase n=1 Tax=Paraferrimonas sedimenticola TaxID=375674 RepID=A0AA37RW24_9GAMM|nr:aminodeoxychorismate/anthranilate synthase component II [Paraferrimonas sedimenticola]GLP95797.1 glutamine amidotransferase [Paraferrimonas sedimenticola]
MLLMLDNYDSFTFNLVQYFQQLGCEVMVIRNDQLTLEQIKALKPERLVISPGPGNPDQAGVSMQVIRHFAGTIPILGVCLGHQCIAQVFGEAVVRAPKVMHGKTSLITHSNSGLFAGLDNPLQVTRYHSLLVERIPAGFELTAWIDEPEQGRLIMAMANPELKLHSVQFHPESVLTQQGHQMLANFLAMS